ncbi:MAG: radical SAM protein [Candidatus Acidiferrum sp.]
MKQSRYNIWAEAEDGGSYLFNGISGGLKHLSSHEREAVEAFTTGAYVDCSAKLLEGLVRGRMLIPDDANELKMLSDQYNRSRYDTSHFGVTLVTSLGCNFDCPYCFEAKHPSIMDDEVQDAILTLLDDQLPKISSFAVNWFGGEPLVGKKPLLALSDRFIEKCDAAGVEYSAQMTTNGYLLTEPTCIELKERRVSSVQVGLDGPADVHDRMRPLADGRGSFTKIMENLHHAVERFSVHVRVNISAENFDRVEQLFIALTAEGFAGKLSVYPGQLVGVHNVTAPSSTYHGCFGHRQFALAEQRFIDLAIQHGLASATLPEATTTPCTAVRSNELVIGSKGELYKCWESVGATSDVIGNIRNYRELNGRMERWLKYDPFQNQECRDCVALPVCMGGCAHHGMSALHYENRCHTFRHTYEEQIVKYARAAASGFVPLQSVSSRRMTMDTR